MSPRGTVQSAGEIVIDKVKVLSGWCIEEQRKRLGITQDFLSKSIGITERWLREIEGGSPKTSLDDHLRCAAAVGLTPGFLLILIMFMERNMTFPKELLLDNLSQIEDRCVACVAEFSVASLARRLQVPARSTSLP